MSGIIRKLCAIICTIILLQIHFSQALFFKELSKIFGGGRNNHHQNRPQYQHQKKPTYGAPSSYYPPALGHGNGGKWKPVYQNNLNQQQVNGNLVSKNVGRRPSKNNNKYTWDFLGIFGGSSNTNNYRPLYERPNLPPGGVLVPSNRPIKPPKLKKRPSYKNKKPGYKNPVKPSYNNNRPTLPPSSPNYNNNNNNPTPAKNPTHPNTQQQLPVITTLRPQFTISDANNNNNNNGVYNNINTNNEAFAVPEKDVSTTGDGWIPIPLSVMMEMFSWPQNNPTNNGPQALPQVQTQSQITNNNNNINTINQGQTFTNNNVNSNQVFTTNNQQTFNNNQPSPNTYTSSNTNNNQNPFTNQPSTSQFSNNNQQQNVVVNTIRNNHNSPSVNSLSPQSNFNNVPQNNILSTNYAQNFNGLQSNTVTPTNNQPSIQNNNPSINNVPANNNNPPTINNIVQNNSPIIDTNGLQTLNVPPPIIQQNGNEQKGFSSSTSLNQGNTGVNQINNGGQGFNAFVNNQNEANLNNNEVDLPFIGIDHSLHNSDPPSSIRNINQSDKTKKNGRNNILKVVVKETLGDATSSSLNGDESNRDVPYSVNQHSNTIDDNDDTTNNEDSITKVNNGLNKKETTPSKTSTLGSTKTTNGDDETKETFVDTNQITKDKTPIKLIKNNSQKNADENFKMTTVIVGHTFFNLNPQTNKTNTSSTSAEKPRDGKQFKDFDEDVVKVIDDVSVIGTPPPPSTLSTFVSLEQHRDNNGNAITEPNFSYDYYESHYDVALEDSYEDPFEGFVWKDQPHDPNEKNPTIWLTNPHDTPSLDPSLERPSVEILPPPQQSLDELSKNSDLRNAKQIKNTDDSGIEINRDHSQQQQSQQQKGIGQLVNYYPVKGKPFISFIPNVEYAHIVRNQ